MEQMVIKYLENNYHFTLSTLVSYRLVDKFDGSEVGLRSVMQTIMSIFNIDDEALFPIWEKWSENKAIEVNNRITDFRYKIYEATGYNVELSLEDMNKVLYSSPDEEFDSTQYDYSLPRHAIESNGKKMR
jgi:hypothetical protein